MMITHLSRNIFILMAFIAILFSCSTANDKQKVETKGVARFKIQPPKNQIVTDSGIKVFFKTFDKSSYQKINFVISGTYGSTILPADIKNNELQIKIPKEITKHASVITWQLIADQETLQIGSFKLVADIRALKAIENYLGPRSIIATLRDYTMLVSIPVDSLDNLLPDGTMVSLQHQFKGTIYQQYKELSAGFTWKRIRAPLRTGRIITGSTINHSSSKELVTDVFPDIPTAFQIKEDSNHNYADGNELITIKTDQIKDAHGNITTDGTLVKFFINDDRNQKWQTAASTINGYAFAKALHPERPSVWTVKGIIMGMVESPELEIKFQSVLKEIPIQEPQNNQITVGPLTSYLGQLIPDGVQVRIKFNGKETLLRTKAGIVTYRFDTALLSQNIYKIQVASLGITTVKYIQLH
jgi:hypothetical protein